MGFKLSSESPKHKDCNEDLVAAIQVCTLPNLKNPPPSSYEERSLHLHLGRLSGFSWTAEIRYRPRHFSPGIYEGESLSLVIAREFDLSPREAESAIEIARQEVAL
jgi:hypothetical protein